MTEVEYTEKALDHLANLDPQVADRVMNEVDEATEWTEHRLERLSGYPYHKLRAGDYRAIMSVQGPDVHPLRLATFEGGNLPLGTFIIKSGQDSACSLDGSS